jgi:hypothetical protein
MRTKDLPEPTRSAVRALLRLSNFHGNRLDRLGTALRLRRQAWQVKRNYEASLAGEKGKVNV